MDRVAVYAHFDAENEIKPYVVAMLRGVGQVCSRIVFVSNSELTEIELDKVRPLVAKILLKDNTGLDFGMWQHALSHSDWTECDELLLTNSSVVGPVFPLAPVMDAMTADPCDFWGMTDNQEYCWHLQSYFLVFKRRVIEAAAFKQFWQSVLPYRDKTQIIVSYELGLTRFLTEQGFRCRAFAPTEAWASAFGKGWMRLTGRLNATLFQPMQLLRAGMPLVKIRLLKDNAGKASLRPVLKAMKDSGYDLRLVQFLI